MLSYLKSLIDKLSGPDDVDNSDKHSIEIASLALLVTIARIDQNMDDSELKTILEESCRSFFTESR